MRKVIILVIVLAIFFFKTVSKSKAVGRIS
jgi:hypothetical protein